MNDSSDEIAVLSTPQQKPSGSTSHFTVSRFLASCRRYWVSMVLVFLVLFVPMALLAFEKPVLYNAEAKILFENDRRINLELSTSLSARESERVVPIEKLNSQAQVLKSTTLLVDLIRELDLAQSDEEEQIELSRLQNTIKIRVIPTSSVLSINYKDRDPKRAQNVVNRLAEIYQQYYLRLIEGENPVKLYQSQYEHTDSALKQDMKALQSLREELGILGRYEAEHKSLMGKVTSLRERLAEAGLSIDKMEVKASLLKQQVAKEPRAINSSTDTIPNPQALELGKELSRLSSEREALQSRYTAKHRKVKRKNQEIAALRARIAKMPRYIRGESSSIINPQRERLQNERDQVQVEIGQLRVARSQLEKDIAESEQRLAVLERSAYQLTSLEDAVDANMKARQQYHSKLVDARFIDAMNRDDILSTSIIQSAIISQPSSKRQETLMLSIALSALLTLGMVLLRDWSTPRLNNADELRALVQVPVLATIPDFSSVRALPPADDSGKGRLQPT